MRISCFFFGIIFDCITAIQFNLIFENMLDFDSKFDVRYFYEINKWLNVIADANGDRDGEVFTCDSTPFRPFTCSTATNPCCYDSFYTDRCKETHDFIECLAAIANSFVCHPSQNRVDTRLAQQVGRRLRVARMKYNRKYGCSMPPY
jgi:hypothetical protein